MPRFAALHSRIGRPSIDPEVLIQLMLVGYCTPGQILSAIACIDKGHATDAAEIREYISGNLRRRGA